MIWVRLGWVGWLVVGKAKGGGEVGEGGECSVCSGINKMLSQGAVFRSLVEGGEFS